MSGSQKYSSPVDFRLGSRLDGVEAFPAAQQVTLRALHDTLNQVIVALTQFCGIGPRYPTLWPVLDQQTTTLLPSNLLRFYLQASENIAAGALVNLHNVAGQLRVRNANATNNTKPCDGYCPSPTGIVSGIVGEVILTKGVVTRAGLVTGTRYYLDTVNGGVNAVAPVAAGNIEQYIGIALSSTALFLNTHYWIQH